MFIIFFCLFLAAITVCLPLSGLLLDSWIKGRRLPDKEDWPTIGLTSGIIVFGVWVVYMAAWPILDISDTKVSKKVSIVKINGVDRITICKYSRGYRVSLLDKEGEVIKVHNCRNKEQAEALKRNHKKGDAYIYTVELKTKKIGPNVKEATIKENTLYRSEPY